MDGKTVKSSALELWSGEHDHGYNPSRLLRYVLTLIPHALRWTPQLLTTFLSERGYDLTKYLPLIYQHNTEQPGPLASPDHYYTDEDDQGQSHINDYWQTVS